MLVVDASVLFEVVADTPRAESLRTYLLTDDDQLAPHLIDAEVLSVIQTKHRVGALEAMGATLVTLDTRLAKAPGIACPVHVPA